MPAKREQTERQDVGATESEEPLWERLKAMREKIAAYPKTGDKADKSFFDELSGDY